MDLMEELEQTLYSSTENILAKNLIKFWGYTKENAPSLNTLKDKYSQEIFNELGQDLTFFEQNISDMKTNFKRYRKVYDLLIDEKSKETFAHMMAAKVYMNLDYVNNVCTTEPIYFNKSIFSFDSDIFVDCGGYDGYSTITFLNSNPRTQKVYLFEGMPDLANKCQQNIMQAGLADKVTIFDKAVYNQSCKLYFSPGQETGDSKISEDGNITVDAIALDQFLNERITFIKMDIEGSEKEAISGAAKLIRNYTPKMAICIYHLKDDFWKIPELILSINPDYHFMVKQHEPSCFTETVLYCIPNNMPKPSGENLPLTKTESDLFAYQHAKAWYIKQLRYKQFDLDQKEQLIIALKDWITQLEEGHQFLEQQLAHHIELVQHQNSLIDRKDT